MENIMYKIPTSYFLRRMAKSESFFEWVDNYVAFLHQMNTRNQFFVEDWVRRMNKCWNK